MNSRRKTSQYTKDNFSKDEWYSSYDKFGDGPLVGPRTHPERMPGPVVNIDPKDYVKPQDVKKKVYRTEDEEKQFEKLCSLCGL